MSDTSARARLNVLIVDDEAPMRALVRRCLDDQPVDAMDASSGAQALEMAADPRTLDLLITDEIMPEMEGHELARRLRHQNPNLKVLYLTGHSDHLFDAKTQLWDLEAYLDKPFTRNGLRQAVALLMAGRLTL